MCPGVHLLPTHILSVQVYSFHQHPNALFSLLSAVIVTAAAAVAVRDRSVCVVYGGTTLILYRDTGRYQSVCHVLPHAIGTLQSEPRPTDSSLLWSCGGSTSDFRFLSIFQSFGLAPLRRVLAACRLFSFGCVFVVVRVVVVVEQGVVRSFHQWRAELQWGNKKRHLGFFERRESRNCTHDYTAGCTAPSLLLHPISYQYTCQAFFVARGLTSTTFVASLEHDRIETLCLQYGYRKFTQIFLCFGWLHLDMLLCGVCWYVCVYERGMHLASTPFARAATVASCFLLAPRACLVDHASQAYNRAALYMNGPDTALNPVEEGYVPPPLTGGPVRVPRNKLFVQQLPLPLIALSQVCIYGSGGVFGLLGGLEQPPCSLTRSSGCPMTDTAVGVDCCWGRIDGCCLLVCATCPAWWLTFHLF